jgi:hypothetical protein
VVVGVEVLSGRLVRRVVGAKWRDGRRHIVLIFRSIVLEGIRKREGSRSSLAGLYVFLWMFVSHNKGIVIATRIVVWGVAVTLSRLVVVRIERVVRPWLAHGALSLSLSKREPPCNTNRPLLALILAADDRSALQ